ncbi:MAG: NADPH:quinone oxidoreductase family protein [Pseudomonadales bacterium]
MRAWTCHEYGSPSGLTLDNVAAPMPRAAEVIIATEAAGLGYVDALFVAGTYQVKLPLPFVPGSEVAGRVVAVGSEVSHLVTGQRILALAPRGALAEQIAVPAASCVPIPDNVSSAAAAAMIVNYSTALYGLRDCGQVTPDERVLVLGAGGGVGLAGVDMARALGAEVIAAAASPAKRQAALRAGARWCVDYSKPSWREELERVTGRKDVNVVWDPVGGDYSETALRCLAPGGRHLVVGFAAGTIPRIPLNLALLKRASIVGVDWGGHIRAHPGSSAPLLETLLAWTAAGRLAPEPAVPLPVSAAPEVLLALLERRMVGKPVLTV